MLGGLKKKSMVVLSVIVILFVWQALSMIMNKPVVLPSPFIVIRDFFVLFTRSSFYIQLVYTLGRGLAGFFLAFLLAVLLGIPGGSNQHVYYLLNPVIVSIRSVPVVSFILLALIWFGSGSVAVFIAVLTMFPILCSAIIDGIRNTEQDLIVMAHTYRVPAVQQWIEVYWPSMAPILFNGMSNALGFGWRSVIIGEVLAQPVRGIGARMHDAQNFLDVPSLIAWTVVAVLISYFSEVAVHSIEKRVMRWKVTDAES